MKTDRLAATLFVATAANSVASQVMAGYLAVGRGGTGTFTQSGGTLASGAL